MNLFIQQQKQVNEGSEDTGDFKHLTVSSVYLVLAGFKSIGWPLNIKYIYKFRGIFNHF